MALARRDSGQPGLAKETLLRALSIAPRSAAAHYNLAQLYDQENEAARAAEHYRRFLENAGAEHASRAAAVRSRLGVLTRGPE
jgi:Tfp pilus assembly protein PilF